MEDNINDDPRVAAAAEAIAKIDDPALTLQNRIKAAIEYALRMQVHPAHQAEVAELIRLFADGEHRALLSCDYTGASRQLDKFYTDLRFSGFSRAPVEVPEIDRVGPTLIALGYNSTEIDGVRTLLGRQPAARAGKITAQGLEIAGAWHSRQSIRDGLRPAYWSKLPARRDDKNGGPQPWDQARWDGQFPAIPRE